MKLLRYYLAIAALLVSLGYGCRPDNNFNPLGDARDKVAAISQTWKVTQALQNDSDISSYLSFDAFRITFSSSGGNPTTYSIEKGGVVAPSRLLQGNWAFDDNAAPTKIILNAGTINESEIELKSPPIAGFPFSIAWNNGCADGSVEYQYKLVVAQ